MSLWILHTFLFKSIEFLRLLDIFIIFKLIFNFNFMFIVCKSDKSTEVLRTLCMWKFEQWNFFLMFTRLITITHNFTSFEPVKTQKTICYFFLLWDSRQYTNRSFFFSLIAFKFHLLSLLTTKEYNFFLHCNKLNTLFIKYIICFMDLVI